MLLVSGIYITANKSLYDVETIWPSRDIMELELLFQNVVNSFAFYNNQVAVAVSGGVDSTVLLHLMTNWAKKKQAFTSYSINSKS